MRMTVGMLRQLLEELEDDVPIIMVHQPTYPILEDIKGVADSRQIDVCEDECGHIMDIHNEGGCTMCDCPYVGEQVDPIYYLVCDGSPYDINPYGPREAFNDYIRP